MAEQTIKLKKKVTLKRKGEAVDFTFNGRLKVKLFWSSATDLDLCLFFRRKDGEVGGVFSNEYRGKKSDLGSLSKFPYILHCGDEKEPAQGEEEEEQIKVFSLDEIDEAYICIVNYTAAVEEKDVTYAEEGGRIEIQSDSGDYLEVIADSKEEGPIYCVCTIKNKDGINSLKKSGGDDEHPEVMDLSTAFDKIPGFALICN